MIKDLVLVSLALTLVLTLPCATDGDLAHASQVHLQKAKLKQAVRRANLIVIARWVKPYLTTQNIPLKLSKRAQAKLARKGKGKGKLPRYPKLLRHFEIVSVLLDKTASKSASKSASKNAGKGKGRRKGERIAVASADWQLMKAMSTAYHNGQPVPSPIVTSYAGGVSLTGTPAARKKHHGKQLILLLWHHGEHDVRLAINGGVLALSNKKAVLDVINKR
jgi:hypothetical protein